MPEKERLTKQYFQVAHSFIGPQTDIPAPDVNTGPREMAWGLDRIRKLTGEWEYAIVTGKPLDLGGSPGRNEATGRGCVYVTRAHMEQHGIDPAASTAIVQGFGNGGQWAAHDLAALGVEVLAVSDTSCCLYAPEGLDVPAVTEYKKSSGRIAGFSGHAPGQIEERPSDTLWDVPATVLVPAALENAVTLDVAKRLDVKLVAEVANGPSTPEANDYFFEKGVSVIPDILANAGGVTVSYYEWVQNTQGLSWEQEEVEAKLKKRMVRAYEAVHGLAAEKQTSMRDAAYAIAIERVAHAMVQRGAQ
jgi:glutamate dehydrogenase/leucine dehydrogenase